MIQQVRAMCTGFAAVAIIACGGSGVVGTGTPHPVEADGGVSAADLDPFSMPDLGTWEAAPIPQLEECNGFDDDLDGEVDEDCGCKRGQSQPCYPTQSTQVVGQCEKGVQKCDGSAEFASWGECVGAVLPSPEVCGDGIDQDCDGADTPCPPSCGDGQCNGSETCADCAADCGVCPPRCGDGQCNGSETCADCAADCGACPPRCGDGQCDGSENCDSCAADCGACPRNCESFVFGTSSRGTDILWVVDQSGSMRTDIARVKAELNSFAAFISASNIDYRVVMMAKRGTDTYGICIAPPLGGPKCTDGPRYAQVNQKIASHDALRLINQRITEIEAPMRKDSLKHIVIVTDDNSQGISPNNFHRGLTARPGFHDYRLHGVIGLTSGGCVDGVGTVYQNLAKRTGGILFDICKANWTTLFQQLAAEVADVARTHYALTKKPKAGTVDVRYAGQPAPQGVDWDYDAKGNQVVLKGTLPADGTAIEVCYEAAP